MLKNSFLSIYNLSILFKRLAGHSKWSNIRHIKAEKDGEKSKLFAKFTRRIILAVQEGKGVGNTQLNQVIEEARRNNMPSSSIEKAIKSAEANNSKAINLYYEIKGPSSCMIIASVFTSNPKKTKDGIASILKKNSGKWAEGCRHMFEGKGLVEAETGVGDSEEAAILAGAEEVQIDLEKNTAVFVCSIEDLNKVSTNLVNMGWKVLESDVIFIPNITLNFSETEKAAAQKLLDKLEEQPEIITCFTNIK